MNCIIAIFWEKLQDRERLASISPMNAPLRKKASLLLNAISPTKLIYNNLQHMNFRHFFLLTLGISLCASSKGATIKIKPRECIHVYSAAASDELFARDGHRGENNLNDPVINVPFLDLSDNSMLPGDYVKITTKGDLRFDTGAAERTFEGLALFAINGNIRKRNRVDSTQGGGSRIQGIRGNAPLQVRSIRSQNVIQLTILAEAAGDDRDHTSDVAFDFAVGTSTDPGVIVRVPQGADALFPNFRDTIFLNNRDPDNDAMLEVVEVTTARPKFSFSSSSYTLPETTGSGSSEVNGRTTITINRTQTQYGCVVYLETLSSTAGASDFFAVSRKAITFAPNQASHQEVITARKDSIYEGTETFKVRISINYDNNPNEAYIKSTEVRPAPSAANYTNDFAEATVRITNTTPKPIIEFAGTSATAQEGLDSSINVPIRITNGVTLASSASLSLGRINLDAEDADLDWPPSPVTIPANSLVLPSFNVALADDDIYEGNEQVSFRLGGHPSLDTSAAALSNPSGHRTVTIVDDENPPNISLTILGASSALENASDLPIPPGADPPGAFIVSLQSDVASESPVNVSLEYSGSAEFGTDYTGETQFTFGFGTLTQIFFGVTPQDDSSREPNESIVIKINTVDSPATPDANSDEITLTLIDDDIPAFAQSTDPLPEFPKATVPAAASWPAGGLEAILPASLDADGNALPEFTPIATWRVQGEPVWRISGDIPTGLAAGLHTIEFRSLSGYLSPRPVTFRINEDGSLSEVEGTLAGNTYSPVAPQLPGSLQVITLPANASVPAPQWKLEGESTWRASASAPVQNIPAGKHRIVLETIADHIPPGTQEVQINSGQLTPVIINYLADTSSATHPEPVDLATTDDSPFNHVGQIKSGTGFASGTAVLDNVVLTAAHVLFDAENLVFTNEVRFYHQRHQDEFVPSFEDDPASGAETNQARAWFVLSGYAAEQANGTAGSSTPRAQYLDVGAAYFPSSVARGGKSGLLESTTLDSEWLIQDELLQEPFDKILVGYPIQEVPYEDRGKMHASPPLPIEGFLSFASGNVTRTYINPTPAGQEPGEDIEPRSQNGVYSTPELVSSGGMSGGGLFVDDNDTFRLAAIYLGRSGASGVFRAIDGNVIDLVDQVNRINNDQTAPEGYAGSEGNSDEASAPYLFEELTVGIGGLDADTPTQGAWRLVGESGDFKGNGESYLLIGADGEDAIVFAPVEGYLTPPIQHITVNDFENPFSNEFHIFGQYLRDFQSLTAQIASTQPDTLPQDLDTIGDYDGDGAQNLIEWASGLNIKDPTDATVLVAGTGTRGLPNISLTNAEGNRRLRIEFVALNPESAPHVQYIPEFSSDLVTWSSDHVEKSITLVSPNWNRHIVEDSFRLTSDTPKRYARVRVVYHPPN